MKANYVGVALLEIIDDMYEDEVFEALRNAGLGTVSMRNDDYTETITIIRKVDGNDERNN